DELVVAYDKAFVKDAPRIGDSDDLTAEQEAELYRYYGVEPPRRSPDAMDDRARDARRIDDQPQDERGTRDAHEQRSGERETHESHEAHEQRSDDHERAAAAPGQRSHEGGPRLRRRIVTEMQTVQVPVQREEIVVERSEEHTSELQSRENLVCRLLLEKKKRRGNPITTVTHDNRCTVRYEQLR